MPPRKGSVGYPWPSQNDHTGRRAAHDRYIALMVLDDQRRLVRKPMSARSVPDLRHGDVVSRTTPFSQRASVSRADCGVVPAAVPPALQPRTST
jgi:hypothetical protein